MPNFHANTGGSRRHPLDRYETPGDVTRALLRRVHFSGGILEPAAASGRIARVLREEGYRVTAQDIETGHNFLERRKPALNIVTNPPYKDGLAEAFVRHALGLTVGRVAMLLRSGFTHSQGRFALFETHRPEMILVIPWRIMFYYADGTRIQGQAHEHSWFIWNNASSPNDTVIRWIDPKEQDLC